MRRTIRPVLRLAVTVTGTLWAQVQQAESQDPVFSNPPMLSSRDGKLNVDLVAAPGVYTLDGHQFQGMLYNGAYIPPIWSVRLGDTVTVTLHNHLSEPTNLHFHGLGVSPLGNGDNVFLHVRPGDTYTYHVKIPEKHIGLFWFHPHMHGNVDVQIIGGMSGGIIVQGSERSIPPSETSLSGSSSLSTIQLGGRTMRNWSRVNGTVAPTYPIRPGEAQLWQMANIGADRFLRVTVEGTPFLRHR